MAELISIAISNAIVAALLGVIAYIICRNTKSLALAHAVWILVLIKLVTPPLIDLPLPIIPQWATSTAISVETTESESLQALAVGEFSDHLTPDITTIPGTAVATDTHSAVRESATESRNASIRETVMPWLLVAWLAGAVLVALYQVYTTAMMARLMKLAVPDPRIDRAMNRIAKAARVSNYPTARVVPWVTSPMLWGLRGTSVIVLPAKLLESIDDDAADTLLLHELAHFQRGDQWVRILEIIVSTIFWWHPVVWLAVHQIEIYEEQCCDAWVVAQDPENRRKYAEALLDTVDFISDSQANAMPLVSSGLGRVRFLKKRVKAILEGKQPVGMTKSGWAVWLIVLALIPFQPILLQASSSAAELAEAESTDSAVEPVLPESDANDAAPGQKQQLLTHVPGPEYARARSAYGTYELTARRGYEVKLNHVVGGIIKDLSDRHISCAAFAPPNGDGPGFVAGDRDGSVWMYECESGKAVELVGEFGSGIQSVDFSRDGSEIVVGTADGSVLIIKSANTKSIRNIDNDAPVRCVRFSADGKQIVVTTDTTWLSPAFGKVEVWDAKTLTRKQTIQCPTAVGAAAMDANGDVLTAEWNVMLRTWSAKGVLIAAVQESKDAVSAAAFSPNAVNLATLGMAENPNQLEPFNPTSSVKLQ